MISSNGYTISNYGSMVRDENRTSPFARALRAAVTPDTVVLDIGTGTGFFALLACQYGARRVFAVEPDCAIEVGRRAAVVNGYADRIQWFRAASLDIELPERANLLISDLRGVMPLLGAHIASIADARHRLLTPDAVVLPRRDVLRMAPIECEREYLLITEPWERNAYGIDMGTGRDYVANSFWRAKIKAEDQLAPAGTLCEIDYYNVTSPNVRGQAQWTAQRAGTMHGFCMWFDLDIGDGNGFSNAPGGPELVYGHAFVPLFRAIEVSAGDRIEVALQANLVGGDYLYRWQTRITSADGVLKGEFRQSSFDSRPLDPAALRVVAEDHVPRLSQDAHFDLEILQSMQQGLSLGTIAQQLADEHPDKFISRAVALDRVAALSKKYSTAETR